MFGNDRVSSGLIMLNRVVLNNNERVFIARTFIAKSHSIKFVINR